MKWNTIFRLLAGFVGLAAELAMSSASAAESALVSAPLLSYQEFVRRVSQNPEAEIEDAFLKTIAADAQKVGVLPDPFVQFGREREPVPLVNPMSDDANPKPAAPAWTLGVTQEFPWPGKLEAQREARLASVKTANAERELARLRREFDAGDYYLSLIFLEKVAVIKRENLRELEQMLTVLRARLQQGLGSHSELLQIQTESELLKNEIDALQNEFGSKRARALVLVGLSPRAEVIFESDFPKEFSDSSLSAKDVPAGNGAIDAIYAAQLAQKLAALKSERLETLPSITGNVALMRDDSRMFMFNAMVGVKVPLFSGKVRGVLDTLPDLNRASTEKERLWYVKKKELALVQWELRLTQARGNLKSLDERLLPLNLEHAKAIMSDYVQGRASYAELSQSRRNVLKLRETRLSTLLQTALEDLNYRRIVAGLADEVIDSPMPKLSLATMESAGSNMSSSSGSGSRGMGGASKSQRNGPIQEAPARPSESQIPEETGGKSSGGGMGM